MTLTYGYGMDMEAPFSFIQSPNPSTSRRRRSGWTPTSTLAPITGDPFPEGEDRPVPSTIQVSCSILTEGIWTCELDSSRCFHQYG